MRKKFLPLIFASFCLQSVYADKEVSVNLRAEVDPELNIERTDDNGTIDLFQRVPSSYRITSNSGKSVKVSVKTDHGWELKAQDSETVIPYVAEFKGHDGLHSNLDEAHSEVEVDKSRLQDSKRYEFSLCFKAKASIEEYAAGTYTDTIHVSVQAIN